MFNAATPPPPDPYWQKWTQSGNALSRQCQHEAAQAAYLEARTIAESLLPTAAQAENPHAIHLYVISCHNLSDSFLCQGQTTEAELMLLKAHRRDERTETGSDAGGRFLPAIESAQR
jgi:hypothetical protein